MTTAKLPAPLRNSVAGSSTETKAKVFILDTCILLTDPLAMFKFGGENHVVIPVEVLEEIDNIKTEQATLRGRNAREVSRLLTDIFRDLRAMKEGVTIEGGGKLQILIRDADTHQVPPAVMTVLRDGRKQDNFIILSAHYAAQTMPPPVILVSNDSNVQLKARAIGLQSESYRNEMVTKEEAAGAEQTSIELTPHELQGFRSKKVAVFGADSDPLLVNEYIKLTDQTGAFEFARAVSATRCVALDFPSPVKIPGGIDFRPRNPEQRCLLDALFNPEISLVVCSGKAGTGKTITAIAAALAQVLGPDARYKQLLISRAIMAMGKDVGYLPGSLEEKMKPWLQSYHDALGVLMSGAKPLPPQFQGKTKSARKDPRRRFGSTTDPSTSNQPKAYEMLTASGLVQIEALSFIRGRSIPNAIMIVDEVQNLNRHEVLSIVTRMSEGAKLVLLGDKDQIDNPFIDEVSNGLMHAAAKTRGQEIAAVIQLRKGERSKLAEMGAKLL